MSELDKRSPVRRPKQTWYVACLVMLVFAVAGCDAVTATPTPNFSLPVLDFSPLPSAAPPSLTPSNSPASGPSIVPSWPVGWDLSFCTTFADVTVDHELVDDIERAIADGSTSDAQGLANQLAQTAPLTASELNKLKTWDPATDVKTSLIALVALDEQVAAAYQSYFNDSVKSALKQARQLRTQVGKQVNPINTQLLQLTALGLSCPDHALKLETLINSP